jgi:hypothetical protein
MADDRRSLLLAEAASRGYFGRAVVAASYRRYRVPGAVEEVGRAVLGELWRTRLSVPARTSRRARLDGGHAFSEG